jgi:hypothetical protein
MRELYVFCEGATEQGFCRQVLTPHLFPNGQGRIHTIKTATSRHHGITHRGGLRRYVPLKRDIQNTLKSRRERNVFFTSIIDVYGLPREFPGKAEHVSKSMAPMNYVAALEAAFAADINDPRFIPHLQLHEYETILFSDPDSFGIAFDDCDVAIKALKVIAESTACIEDIDNGAETAPSKRIIAVLPAYEGRKVSAGPDIAEFIGIPTIREKCPHFDQWLKKLEQLDWNVA